MTELKSISFENYKVFPTLQELEIKPITILIGKNSSGKSSVAKLFPLFENSLSSHYSEPLLYNNNGVELGASFINLVYNMEPANIVSFKLSFWDEREIHVSILNNKKYVPQILEWKKVTNGQNDLTLKYDVSEKGYKDDNGQLYECTFRGFIPQKIIKRGATENEISKHDVDFKIDVDYIGPFRILPDRLFYLSGQSDFQKIGVKGENAYAILAVSKLEDTSLHIDVGNWFSQNFDGWKLIVNDSSTPYFEILLEKEIVNYSYNEHQYGKSIKVNIVDVGQGMNQALPLIVRSYMAKPKSIIVLEQPELHLHPAAHGNLAELFARSAKTNNQKFVIETHSENIILRLRKLIVENDFGFTSNDFAIYWVDDEDKGRTLTKITVNEEGILSDWPENVFTENVKEILEIQKAIAKKKND